MSEILVSVICLTYNHEKYIKQALDGFVKQITDFSFEILVNDDASTDGTKSILQEYEMKYPDLMRVFYQPENQFVRKLGYVNSLYLISQARGKYIAICEGDDFWYDCNKLQMQVDILEQHDECTGCCCNALLVKEDGRPWEAFMDESYYEVVDKIYGKERLLNDLKSFHTATIMMRKSIIHLDTDAVQRYINCKANGDMKWAAIIAATGKLYHISKSLACYRFVPKGNGSWSARNAGKNLSLEICNMVSNIQQYIREEYGVDLDYRYHIDYQTRRSIRQYIKNRTDENRIIMKGTLAEQKNRLHFLFRSIQVIVGKPLKKKEKAKKSESICNDIETYRLCHLQCTTN